MRLTVDGERGNRLAALPLAVTLALHLLLLGWLARPVKLVPDDPAQRRSVLVMLPLAHPRARVEPAPVASARRQPAAPAHPSAVATSAPPVRPDPPDIPATTPPQATPAESPARYSLEADELLGSAKRQAGKIDRELRGGKPGVPREADTPWARFRGALAAAHVDRSHTMVQDSYTGADGVTIYRIRQGDKVFCRQGGGTRPDMPGRTEGAVLAGAGRFDTLGMAGTAGTINCPTGEHDWVAR
jgi:hypothetical protein